MYPFLPFGEKQEGTILKRANFLVVDRPWFVTQIRSDPALSWYGASALLDNCM